MNRKDRFIKELKQELKGFMQPYNTVYKIIPDSEGVLLGVSLTATPSNKDFDLNVVYRVAEEDILQKDITYFFKITKILRDIKTQLKVQALDKYLKTVGGESDV